MQKKYSSKWVWYAIVAAVVVGLFAPTMAASAAKPVEEPTGCVVPIRR